MKTRKSSGRTEVKVMLTMLSINKLKLKFFTDKYEMERLRRGTRGGVGNRMRRFWRTKKEGRETSGREGKEPKTQIHQTIERQWLSL